MNTMPITETLERTLRTVALLERQHREAQHHQEVVARLNYLEARLEDLQRDLRSLRRVATVLRRVFRDRRGDRLWRQVREEVLITMPRQLSSPGRALSEGDSALLGLTHYLGAASARVSLRVGEVAEILEAELASECDSQRRRRSRIRLRLRSYLQELAVSEDTVLPKNRAQLLAKLALGSHAGDIDRRGR